MSQTITSRVLRLTSPGNATSRSGLLGEALMVSPVACTKKGLRELIQRQTACQQVAKKPAKKQVMKKPAGSLAQYSTMMYKTSAVGVRVKGGKQLFQVLCKKNPGNAKAIALGAIKKLESGVPVDQVKAWVDQEKVK